MLYLAWDRENNISLFFASSLYENEAPGLEQAAVVTLATRVLRPLKKGIFVLPPWVPNCMQNLKGGWKFWFPKMFDSYGDLFLIIHLDRVTGAWFWNFTSVAKITHKIKFVCQQFSYEVPCHNIAEFATTRNRSDCNNDLNIYLDNLWRCGSLHELFFSFERSYVWFEDEYVMLSNFVVSMFGP